METPSPFTPLGAKGVGEGNCMSTPVCIANAVADAIGAENVTLPLTPARVSTLLNSDERPATKRRNLSREASGTSDFAKRPVHGDDKVQVTATQQGIWDMLISPEMLKRIVPGCHSVRQKSPTEFEADVTFGVGPVKGNYAVALTLHDLNEPHSVRLEGEATGALGTGQGEGTVQLKDLGNGVIEIDYSYGADVSGKISAVGDRLINGATRVVLQKFFENLASEANSHDPTRSAGESNSNGDTPNTSTDDSKISTLLRWFKHGMGDDQ